MGNIIKFIVELLKKDISLKQRFAKALKLPQNSSVSAISDRLKNTDKVALAVILYQIGDAFNAIWEFFWEEGEDELRSQYEEIISKAPNTMPPALREGLRLAVTEVDRYDDNFIENVEQYQDEFDSIRIASRAVGGLSRLQHIRRVLEMDPRLLAMYGRLKGLRL